MDPVRSAAMAVVLAITAVVLAQLGFIFATLIAGRIVREPIHRVGLGIGPGPTVHIKKTPLKLGCLPLGAFVQFGDGTDDYHDRMPTTALIILLIAGLIGSALLALLAGPADIVANTWWAMRTAVTGAISPVDVGAGVWESAWAALRTRSAIELIGWVGVIHLAINALPLPLMSGGMLILAMLRLITRRPLPEPVRNAMMLIGLLATLVLFALWLFALYVAIFGESGSAAPA